MKIVIPMLVLVGLMGCDPVDRTNASREDLEQAQEGLARAREDAAEKVAEATEAGAVEVEEAAAAVDQARDDLVRKLDKIDAEIAALEAVATTPAARDEVVEIRERQDTIVVRVRDHDKDGITWAEIERDVEQALDELGRDIETTRVKVVEKK